MVDEKAMKADFRKKAQQDPEKYYPVQTLIEEGFARKKCAACGNYFWSYADRTVCGEPECSGGYTFIGDSPAGKKMDFIETWQEFASLFSKLDYTPIERYPVAARWRADTDFVQASIYDFQPYVVSGEIDPPANPLVVPQFCLRFNDIDNVGITGRHNTGFVMIGQHAFEPPERYAPNDYLSHIYRWLIEGMELPKEEIQFHEDSWAGGGNMGPSMEFFSRGLEIGNQVYMQYDIKDGHAKELGIKVLDMGMGQERPAWFTHGTSTSYEAIFPTVVKKLYDVTGIKPDHRIFKEFLPYSGLLNVDEVENVDKIWAEIAAKLGIDTKELKEHIIPLSGIYSIADHTRSLLVALTDGALPSNVGGGYNLRVLVRRALDFIDHHGWDLYLPEICRWHADYLKPQFPELSGQLDGVEEILEVERRKYGETKKKSRGIVSRLKGKKVPENKLYELYDSNGISPEMLKAEGLGVDIPADFYQQVSARHEKAEQKAQTHRFKEFPLPPDEKTEILYYHDYLHLDFEATVTHIFEDRYVVLDRTAFYPTSGGQLSDIGEMNGCVVTDVFKQGQVILHRVEKPSFKEGDTVACSIDRDRRVQLAQHHTATHIINGVARKLLGEHIWQAGAEKTPKKSRLDITHYESLTQEQLEAIKEGANDVIQQGITVLSQILPRDKAEAAYGFRLYQGGAVPGLELRIISIPGLDTEACGGTHTQTTKEVEYVDMIGSTKIQDGIVRLEYVAGKAARDYMVEAIFEPAERIIELIGEMAEEIFEKGDNAFVSSLAQGIDLLASLKEELRTLGPIDQKDQDHQELLIGVHTWKKALSKAAGVFSVNPQQVPDTLQRFIREIFQDLAEANRLRAELGEEEGSLAGLFDPSARISVLHLPGICKGIFDLWADQRKEVESLGKMEAQMTSASLSYKWPEDKTQIIIETISASGVGIQKTAQELIKENSNRVVVLFGKEIGNIPVIGLRGKDLNINMGILVTEICKLLGGGGGGKPDFARGAGVNKDKLEEAMEFAKKRIKEELGE